MVRKNFQATHELDVDFWIEFRRSFWQ